MGMPRAARTAWHPSMGSRWACRAPAAPLGKTVCVGMHPTCRMTGGATGAEWRKCGDPISPQTARRMAPRLQVCTECTAPGLSVRSGQVKGERTAAAAKRRSQQPQHLWPGFFYFSNHQPPTTSDSRPTRLAQRATTFLRHERPYQHRDGHNRSATLIPGAFYFRPFSFFVWSPCSCAADAAVSFFLASCRGSAD